MPVWPSGLPIRIPPGRTRLSLRRLTLADRSAAALDATITQQATMIGYLNDFRLMFYLTLAVLPIVFLLRAPRRVIGTEEVHAVME